MLGHSLRHRSHTAQAKLPDMFMVWDGSCGKAKRSNTSLGRFVSKSLSLGHTQLPEVISEDCQNHMTALTPESVLFTWPLAWQPFAAPAKTSHMHIIF